MYSFCWKIKSTNNQKATINAINEAKKQKMRIKNQILNLAIAQKIDFSGLIITNIRHMEAINQAIEQIENLQKECKNQTVDILDMLAKNIWATLGKITGETENEDIISGIFAKFCLGK